MQAERAHEPTHSPIPHPGVAGRSRNPSPNTHTHTAHPCQEWLGASGARTQTRTPHHPGQEWPGAAETRAQTHTPTPHTPARSGGVQAERAYEPTHSPTPQPRVAGRSRNLSSNRHTQDAHPCQEWLGAGGARTRAHTQPNTQARSGGAHPKPKPKHTHPHRAPVPGVAGCKQSTHTNTHTATPQPRVAGRSRNLSSNRHTQPAHPCQEWLGAGGARTRAHTQPNTQARSGGLEPKPKPKHTHPHRAPVPGVAGCKQSTNTNTHTPSPQPGMAGRSRNQSPNTHTHTAHPSQEWRGASGARIRAHTQPNTPATSGGAQPKPELKQTHPTGAPVPGVAGCRRSAHTSTHTAQHPSQEWRGAPETQA